MYNILLRDGKKYLKHKFKGRTDQRILMKAILRIFKYCRKRIIELSIRNRQLELQLQYYRAIIESEEHRKH
jgi:hypothetical protein